MTATADPDAAAAALRSVAPTRPMARGAADDRAISQVPYMPGLDGLRAIAVVAVMIYHANSTWLVGGYLGVEVFFVISGYLITLLLIAEHERTGAIDLKDFWMRRARRLLPALFVMMLLVMVWVAVFERAQLGKLRGDVVAGATYVSNWYEIWIGEGYAGGNDFAPLRHLWSLAVEEQFYVIWPLVMLALVRAGSRRIARMARWLVLAAVAITVVVAFLSYSGPQQTPELTPDAYWTIFGRPISKPDALYLATISRAGGLLLGAAFAMVWRPVAVMRGPLRDRAPLFDLGALLGLAALALMAWTVTFQPDQGVGFLFHGGLFLTGVATLAVIAAVTHRGGVTGRALSVPVILWIGTRSYGLYLFHWPIYQIVRNVAAVRLQIHEFALAIIATCIVTELSYRYVETPIRQGRLGDLWRRRRAGVPLASGLTDRQRAYAYLGAMAALVLIVFALVSMFAAPLRQNDVATALDENQADTCDVLRDVDCDGTLDLDEAGNPIAAIGEPSGGADDGVGAAADTDASGAAGSGAEAEAVPVETSPAATTVPPTTAPPTTLPPPTEKLAVGDSLLKGAASEVADLGYTVDAEASRWWADGTDLIEALRDQDRLPTEVLVIHLGTNGGIVPADMDRMMEAVADVPTVLLLTNHADREWTAGNNAQIYEAVNTYDNVRLLDWDGLAQYCPGECFLDDGYHVTPKGAAHYAWLITEVLAN